MRNPLQSHCSHSRNSNYTGVVTAIYDLVALLYPRSMCVGKISASTWRPAGALCCHRAVLCWSCITGLGNGMRLISQSECFKLYNHSLLICIEGSSPTGLILVACMADKFTWYPPCFPVFIWFIIIFGLLAFVDGLFFRSTTRRINLSLLSLLDQLKWRCKKSSFLTPCKCKFSVPSPLCTDWSPLFIGPWIYCRHPYFSIYVIVNTIPSLVLLPTPLS